MELVACLDMRRSTDLTSSLVLTFPALMSSLIASTILSAVLGPKSAACGARTGSMIRHGLYDPMMKLGNKRRGIIIYMPCTTPQRCIEFRAGWLATHIMCRMKLHLRREKGSVQSGAPPAARGYLHCLPRSSMKTAHPPPARVSCLGWTEREPVLQT